ncbi:MAG: hypothetical protein GY716_18470 [bacterium]|nr:hypothetical protein [bacterium]
MTNTMRDIGLLAAMLLIAAGGGSCTDADSAARRGWRHLRLDIRSVPLGSGKLDMRVAQRRGTTLLETDVVARFMGAKVAEKTTTSELDSRTGLPRSFESWSPKRGRRYVFEDERYIVTKLKPAGDPHAPLDEWNVTTTREFEYPRNDEGDAIPVHDFYGMLLHLARQPLDHVGDAITLHVATSRGPTPYRIVVAETRTIERPVADLAQPDEKKKKKKRRREFREQRLRIIPADPENADEGFLKMEGEVELWVDARTKAIHELSGNPRKIPGRVELVLIGIQ